MKKLIILIAISIFGLCISTSAYAIGIRLEATSGGILEDAILIASMGGEPARDAVALGDFDLSVTDHVYDITVDPGLTHWWLIGHQGGDVVYSSLENLDGVEMYTLPPYDIAGAELAWDIPAQLDAFQSGTASFDWWAQTVTNHQIHVAPDGGTSNLWKFSSPGSEFGSIAINVYSNEIPGGQSSIPEPTTILLFGFGLLGLVGVNRKKPFK